MKFSIGYNHDIKLLDLLGSYKDNIESFYFTIPLQYLRSGRRIPQENSYLHEIPEIIKKCNSLNLRSQLLLNATCGGEHGLEKKFFKKIINYIEKLKSLGLNSVIVTNPIYISKIKEHVAGIQVESSVNCYVKTLAHALYLKDLGVDILTVDRDINRDLPLIKEIKNKTGLKIKILLNEGCLGNCPFRNIHYNHLSHNVPGPGRLIDNIFPDRFCINIFSKKPAKVLSIPFIPPEVLPYYAQIADYYKLSTRVFSTSRIESCLKAYINQDFNGNLLDLLDCPGLSYFNLINYALLKKNNLFGKMTECDNNCGNCHYCNKLMKDAVVINSVYLKGPEKVREDKKALGMYNRFLKTSPNSANIYFVLGRACFHLKKYKEAIKNIKKAIELDFTGFNVHFLLGSCYERTKQYEKAIFEFKKAEKADPGKALLNFSLSKCYRNIGQIEQADKELEKGDLKFKRSKQITNS